MLQSRPATLGVRGTRELVRVALKAPVSASRASKVVVGAVQIPNAPVSGPAPVSDASVPEGHRSLHASLYGEGGAEEHDAVSEYTTRETEDDGSSVVDLLQWLEDRDGEKPLGVYAIYDDKSQVQYIGYSRNMVIGVRGHHTRVGASRANKVRAMVFNNKAMATREHLEREVASWVTRYAGGVVPIGNTTERELWDGAKAMSQAEAQAYAEKAAKLKRAMGEGVGQGAKAAEAQEAAVTPEQRRQAMREAVEGKGDWSAVVDGPAAASGQGNWQQTVDAGDWSQEVDRQTQEAVSVAQPSTVSTNGTGAAGGATSGGGSGPIVSPFTQPNVHRSIGESGRGGGAAGGGGDVGGMGGTGWEERPMTVESVDNVLNEVRPYLVADGGDVEVVNVEDGRIFLRLQGSCSTCASSSATMKMGIERALQAAFGDALKEVIQVDKVDVVAPTVVNMNLHLDMLRGAIHSFGGKVEVVEVSGAKATLKYKGPPAIGKGVSAAIRDRFPAIREVVVIDF